MERIAPVVLPVLTSGWHEQLRVPSTVAGRSDAGRDVVARVDAAIEELASDVADLGFVALSEEVLGQQDADVVIALVDGAPGSPSVLDLEVLRAALDESTITSDVFNGAWSVATPLSAWWMLRDLRAILLYDGEVATVDAAAALWDELVER